MSITNHNLEIAFWACIISANVWSAAGKGYGAFAWLFLAVVIGIVRRVKP